MRDFCRCCTRTHALEGETALEWECVADCVLTATQQQQQQPKQWQRRRERARRRRRRHNSFTIKNVGAFAYALSHSLSLARSGTWLCPFMKCKRFACGFSCFLLTARPVVALVVVVF